MHRCTKFLAVANRCCRRTLRSALITSTRWSKTPSTPLSEDLKHSRSRSARTCESISSASKRYAAVSDRALIRLDANQGWTSKQTVSALRELESSGVELEFIEQPVRGDDIEGMKYVTERVSTPVMADESTFGPKQVIDLIQVRGADIINIKLMKTGGISNAIKIADIAAVYDVECMMGCMLETSIGVSAAAHVAVARASSITRVDLDAPSLGTVNPVVGGVTFDESEIRISDAPGLGIESISELSMLSFDKAVSS